MPFSWEKCIEELGKSLPEQHINRWLRTVQVVENSETLLLFVPNEYTEDWIRGNCFDHIKDYYKKIEPAGARKIKLLIGGAISSASPNDYNNQGETHQMSGHSGTFSDTIGTNGTRQPLRPPRPGPAFRTNLNTCYTFDGLVSGPPNDGAIAAAKGMTNKTPEYNPLFIYGGVGLGKTHIMHALGNEFLKNNPGASVAYRHAEQFVSEMVNAFRDGKIELFKRFYRSLDMLLLDDVQMFVGKNQTQEEFFHTFNALVDGRRRIVLSSDRYPTNLKGLQERLTSRFCSGLCQNIEPPGLEMRVAILEKKALSLALNLSRDAAFFIAGSLPTNVRELEGALNRLKVTSQFTDEDITIPFIKNTLSDIIGAQNNQITIEIIQKAVAQYYTVRVSDICSKRRTQAIVRPRQIAMALAKDLTSHSYPEIGSCFGGRDHTTVIHACRKIKEIITNDPEVDISYRNIKATLKNGWANA